MSTSDLIMLTIPLATKPLLGIILVKEYAATSLNIALFARWPPSYDIYLFRMYSQISHV